MEEIVTHSKITPPKLSNVLHRERLIETIEGYRDRKAILILGQAAQGKSTLAATYSQKCGIESAWINLTEEESDPVNLFRLIVHSVQNALEKDDFSGLLKYVSADLGPREETLLFRRWANFLVQGVSSRVQIVLDGLEQLSPDSPSFGLLGKLLEEADSKVRFILLSREVPPLDIQKRHMKQEAAIIDNEQLAFTTEETEAFFKETCSVSLPANQIKRVHALTEGWAGGLLIFSEALRRRPEDAREKFLSEVFIGEVKQKAFQYLREEIFSSLGEREKDFLIKSSILEVIDPASAGELLETNDAETILTGLAERNLFIQMPYRPGHEVLFKYHQVFREFLHFQYKLKTSRGERRGLHLKAARVFERIGDDENALSHYLKAKAYPKASNVLERIGINLFIQGRIGDLAERLRLIPDGFVQKSPWLLLYICMTRRFTAARENTPNLTTCIRMFEEREDARGQLLSFALLLEAFFLAGYHPTPIKDLVSRAELLLNRFPQNLYAYESAILWFQIGHIETICCGNPRKGFWCCNKARLIAAHCGDIGLQVSAMSREVEALGWLGEFEWAGEIVSELQNFVETSPYPELRAFYLIAVSELSTLRGETDKAREQISLALETVEKNGLIFWHLPALAVHLPISIYSGELESAENYANNLLDLALSYKNSLFEGVAMFFSTMIRDRKGDLTKAKELAVCSARILSSEESLTLWHYYGAIVLDSLISHRLGEDEGSDEKLRGAIDCLRKISCYTFLIDAHIVMAFIKRKQGMIDAAARNLKEGFRLAEEKKHYHTLLLKREDLADACVMVIELKVSEAVGYASHLLSTHLSDLADSRLEKLKSHPDAATAAYARDMRKTIYRSTLSPLRIECFGNFRVFRGDRPIEDREWARAQARNLLKALVSRGAWKTSRDVLMEDIWPEGEPNAIEKNFKVTLHRLRKTLEPEMNQAYGSAYVHLRENCLSLDRDLCAIDTDDFLDLTLKGRQEEGKGNFENALSFYGRAADLYQGDFLEEDLYMPWAGPKREEFRSIFTEILSRMGSILERQNRADDAIGCYQKIVRVDPCFEKAYQKMMSLYAKLGMRNAALKVYQECKKALYDELDSEPDETTVEIYRKIAGKK